MLHAVRDPALASHRRLAAWDPASSIPSLVGSLLSATATLTVILLWIFAAGAKRRDFRYALILNLTVAEFLNSMNNSISGIVVVNRKAPLFPSAACNFNGWLGQFSVQAIDFSILAISIVTLLIIQLRSFIIYATTTTKALICLSIWVIPLFTSVYAWIRGYYGPVSGNWCWIEEHHGRQRYSLTHGLRFAILFITLCTYIFVFVYMSRRLRPQDLSNISMDSYDQPEESKGGHRRAVLSVGSLPGSSSHEANSSSPPSKKGHNQKISMSGIPLRSSMYPKPSMHVSRHSDPDFIVPTRRQPSSTDDSDYDIALVDIEKTLPRLPAPSASAPHDFDMEKYPQPQTPSVSNANARKAKIDREIWKMMLLNMYPVTYLILWLPGIANRFAEATGHSIRALVILQSSTQFIGAANATVYLCKEHGKDISHWWNNRWIRDESEAPKDALSLSTYSKI